MSVAIDAPAIEPTDANTYHVAADWHEDQGEQATADRLRRAAVGPLYLAAWLDFPVGNRAYGGGGWSRRAKYRPAPELVTVLTRDVDGLPKATVMVNGRRKRKLNLYLIPSGELVREDYADLPGVLDQLAIAKTKAND